VGGDEPDMTNDELEIKDLMEQPEEVKSRSQIKREMVSLQQMGERLVGLSDDQIQVIDMPDDLREAALSAKKLKSHGARKRQLKFVGALMRKIDTSPISDALYEIDRGRSVQVAEFHMIEKIRDELVKGNDAPLEDIIGKFPNADRQKLRQLVRNARKELNKNKPPKSSRALFKYIKKLAENSH